MPESTPSFEALLETLKQAAAALLREADVRFVLGGGLAIWAARTVREQIDWDDVRKRTDGSPFAKAFFTLVDELGVSD